MVTVINICMNNKFKFVHPVLFFVIIANGNFQEIQGLRSATILAAILLLT